MYRREFEVLNVKICNILQQNLFGLQVISLWTIINLFASESSEAAKILISQKIVTKLLHVMTDKSAQVDIVSEAQTALNVLLVRHPELVRTETNVNDLLISLVDNLKVTQSSLWLRFAIIYHTCEAFEYEIDQQVRLQVIEALVSNLSRQLLSEDQTDEIILPRTVKTAVFVLRTIGNLIVDDELGKAEMRRLLAGQPDFFQQILRLDDVLARDVLCVVALIGYELVGELQVPNSIRAGLVI